MNKIQQWDQQVCRVCLLHAYNRPQARVSRLVSRTGDGPLYAVLAALLWWQGEAERELVRLALLAFAIELPLYLLLKNSLKRQR
ncbi:MAG: phosphatase PAP2 family protein, partial [Aeromonas sobria]